MNQLQMLQSSACAINGRDFNEIAKELEVIFHESPPQPYLCIYTQSDAGKQIYINVLTWGKIGQYCENEMPFHGGIRVHSRRRKSSALVFAVFAHEEKLNALDFDDQDPSMQHAVLESICNFIEENNPIKLVGNPVILKHYKLWGELKNSWKTVCSFLKYELMEMYEETELTQQEQIFTKPRPIRSGNTHK